MSNWKRWCPNGCGKSMYALNESLDNEPYQKKYYCHRCKKCFRKISGARNNLVVKEINQKVQI